MPSQPGDAAAAPLSGPAVVSLDLADELRRAPTWVTRVEKCLISYEPDGSLFCDVRGGDDTSGGQYGGIRFKTGPISAAQFDMVLVRPKELDALYIDFVQTGTNQHERWIWRGPRAWPSSLIVRSGEQAPPFEYAAAPQGFAPDSVDFFVKLRGTRAKGGFAVHRMLYVRSDKVGF